MKEKESLPPPPGEPLATATVFKGTTLPYVVVQRTAQLFDGAAPGVATHQADKGAASGKFWPLHARCRLDPAEASGIRAHERHLRKAGPLRAVASYARDKNMLKLYCFRIEWPDKHAPSHGSMIELGFSSAEAAREWHAHIGALVQALAQLNGSGGGSALASADGGPAWSDAANGSSLGASPDASVPCSPMPVVGRPPVHPGLVGAAAFASPRDSTAGGTAPPAVLAAGGSRGSGQGGGGSSGGGAAANGSAHVPPAGGRNLSTSSSLGSSHWSAGGSPGDERDRDSSVGGGGGTGYPSGYTAGYARGSGPGEGAGVIMASGSSMDMTETLRSALQASSVGAGHSSGVQPPGGSLLASAGPSAAIRGSGRERGSAATAGAVMANGRSPTPPLGAQSGAAAGGGYAAALAAEAAATNAAARGRANGSSGGDGNGMSSSGGAAAARVVVDGSMSRWVPYKHSNGMAIYYRHAPSGERPRGAARQAAGEYMLSAAVAASPERCVAALQSGRCGGGGGGRGGGGGGGIVSVASHLEILEDEGDMQVRHMVFHPAGSAGTWGAFCAPREAFVRQVLTSYEEGVYNILFDSIPSEELKPEWRAKAAARARTADNAARASDPTASARCWRGRPVRAKITGAFTLSALEGKGGRDSPQTLVTAILRADFGGWLSPASWLFQFTWAMGLQEALMDRLLMTVMILREEVEYSRFRTKPFQLLMCAANSAADGSRGGAPPPSSPQHLHHYQQQQGGHGGSSFSAAAGAGLPHLRRNSLGGGGGGGSVSTAAAATAAGGAPAPSGGSASMAAAAASAVSAAAGALAAHMLEPQSLFRRGRPTPAAAVADGGAHGGGGAAAAPGAANGVAVSGAAALPSLKAAAAAAAAAAASAGGAGTPGPRSPTTAAAIEAAAAAAGAAAAAAGAGRLAAAAAAAAAAQRAAFEAGAATSPPRFDAEDFEEMFGGTIDPELWEPIHIPGAAQVFSIRGPNYLRDRKKIPAGTVRYRLIACDLVATPTVVSHVARFIPSIRLSGCPFMFVVNLLIPGTGGAPCVHLVMTFGAPYHPSSLGACPDDPLDAGPEWTPFDFTMSRFLHASDYERNGTFKLIPHCAKGSWIICQTVGTTPVILGRKLPTTSYVLTDRYVEVDCNVATAPAVSYVVNMVRGATRSMVIDHAYLLEGHFAHELPEALVGAVRFKHLDMGRYVHVDTAHEIRMAPVDPDWA